LLIMCSICHAGMASRVSEVKSPALTGVAAVMRVVSRVFTSRLRGSTDKVQGPGHGVPAFRVQMQGASLVI
jgi:hypothetical protein